MRRHVAIDFDGTIVDWQYPACGAVKEGAREAIQRIRNLGFYIVIWSCRTCNWFPGYFPPPGISREFLVSDMERVLNENQIPYDEIDDGSRGKPMAEFYIDDKAIRFEDNWKEIADFVTKESH